MVTVLQARLMVTLVQARLVMTLAQARGGVLCVNQQEVLNSGESYRLLHFVCHSGRRC